MKHHYFHLIFGGIKGLPTHTSTIKLEKKCINSAVLNSVRQESGLPEDVPLLSSSYFGHMTKEEWESQNWPKKTPLPYFLMVFVVSAVSVVSVALGTISLYHFLVG